MPSDVVTIVVTTGIGVSVIAGFLSGVCYILIHGCKTKRNRSPALQWYCAVCGKYIAENIKVVICIECEERVCKRRCSKHDIRKGWICYTCLKRPSWVESIVKYLRFRYNYKHKITNKFNQREIMGENSEAKEKMYVRDFIEKLVSTILGSSVDDASISRIYKDKHYETFFIKYHRDLRDAISNLSSELHTSRTDSPLSEEGSSSAHSNLKYVIDKILKEASRLPHFRKLANNRSTDQNEPEQTYEELLATAIINKIISKHEGDVPFGEASLPEDQQNRRYRLKNGHWKTEKLVDLDSISSSSSDSNLSSTKYTDSVSWTIRQKIEEVTPTEDLDIDEHDFEPLSRTNSLLRNDDSNWYLQRRQFSNSNSPVPVPMLVPNSLMNAKVLIGDQEAAETSDLSDATSDCEDETSPPENVNFLIEPSETVSDKTLTIGQELLVSDEESSFDSGVREDRDDFSDKQKNYEPELKTDITVDDENVEDVSLGSGIEQDTEYFEKYGSLPKRVYSVPSYAFEPKYDALNMEEQSENVEPVEKDTDENVPLFEGSYSKREKEKWNRPVSMPNNPYCEENIMKRIASNKIFGRDYYARQASSPSGKIKKEEEDFWQTESNSSSNELFRAVPVTTEDSEISETTSSFFDSSIDQNSSELTNDSDLSLANCYDVENCKIYYCPPDNKEKKIEIKLNEKQIIIPDAEIRVPTQNFQKEDTPPQSINKINNTQKTFRTDEKPKTTENFNKTYEKIQPIPAVRTNQTNSSSAPAKVINKKSDNTLIKKIYSDPNVRNFALQNRSENIFEPIKETKEINNNIVQTPKPLKRSVPDSVTPTISEPSEYETNNTFSLEFSDNGSLHEPQAVESDNEIQMLRQQRLVAHRLGEFSTSFPNLNKISVAENKIVKESQSTSRDDLEESNSEDTTPIKFVSVKDLRKLFENKDVSPHKDKPVHSLTARSISKNTKEKLRNVNNDYENDSFA